MYTNIDTLQRSNAAAYKKDTNDTNIQNDGQIEPHTRICKRRITHTRTHARTQARTHARTHAHTHTHTTRLCAHLVMNSILEDRAQLHLFIQHPYLRLCTRLQTVLNSGGYLYKNGLRAFTASR